MSKFKGTKVAGISAFAALAIVVGGSTVAVANGYNPFPAEQPAAVVETAATTLFVGTTENGLAAEEEATAAAAVEAARVAAEAQAAADAAAAAQAAAEAQAAADAAARQAAEESSASDDSSEGESAPSRTRATWVDLGNGTGLWDFSNCPTGSGSTGSDGAVYCN